MYYSREAVDAVGLIGADSTDPYRARLFSVDKILKFANPADLRVQQATKFEFVIDLQAAQQIGLTIPVRMLGRANQVIK